MVRAWKIRARIHQWIGIPCGIGIAGTKTQAKLANHIAKTAERKPGVYPDELATVCNLAALSDEQLREVLTATEVGEVWGVGRQLSAQLKAVGVYSVHDFVQLPGDLVRSKWGVVLERTWRELRGEPCIDLDNVPAPKQQIACTRSFGLPVTELKHLQEAISEFTTRAAEKLRRQHHLAGQVLVFARTSPFRATTSPVRSSPAGCGRTSCPAPSISASTAHYSRPCNEPRPAPRRFDLRAPAYRDRGLRGGERLRPDDLPAPPLHLQDGRPRSLLRAVAVHLVAAERRGGFDGLRLFG